MTRDKTVAEMEAELDLKEPHVPLVEDSPEFMVKKKEYCESISLRCADNCGNYHCKCHQNYVSNDPIIQ